MDSGFNSSGGTSNDMSSNTACDFSATAFDMSYTDWDISTSHLNSTFPDTGDNSVDSFWNNNSSYISEGNALSAWNAIHNRNTTFPTSHNGFQYGRKKTHSNEGSSRQRAVANTIIYLPGLPEDTPSVVPDKYFDQITDAHALRSAMKAFFVNRDLILKIICRRPNVQRQIIKGAYFDLFGRYLIEDIRLTTNGDFKKLLIALLTPIANFHAKELHNAVDSNLQTYENDFIEVLCSCSNYQINAIKQVYATVYGKNLENELKLVSSFHFKYLLKLLLSESRDESNFHNNYDSVNRDAREMMIAVGKSIPDQITIANIFTQRSFHHIKLIFEQFHHISGHSLEVGIKKGCDGDFARGAVAIIQYAVNKSAFFATRLHRSIMCNNKQTIRLFATRCEVDLNDIKIAYQRLYGRSLRNSIQKHTSGDYKHALYTLIGEECSKVDYQ